jgi:hypothetical protein
VKPQPGSGQKHGPYGASVLCLVEVDHLLGASVLGEAAWNLDGFNNALHVEAAREGGYGTGTQGGGALLGTDPA